VLRNRSAATSILSTLACRVGLAALTLGLGLSAALAARGLVVGSEMQGFGRIVFSLDKEVSAKTRVVNSVLIVEFDEQITVDLEKLNTQLPNYVSVARADPDGKSLRFALNDRYRVDLKPAAERLYLDLLPPRWQGLPPALPAEVVQDLVRRARDAESRLRKLQRESDRKLNRDIEVKIGSTPQFRRAIFQMPWSAPVDHTQKDGQMSILFEGNFQLSRDLLRARLAGLATDIDVESSDDAVRVTLRPHTGLALRSFREDDTLTLDFSRTDGKPIDTDPPPQAAAAPAANANPAQPAANPAAPARVATPANPAAPASPAAPAATPPGNPPPAATTPPARTVMPGTPPAALPQPARDGVVAQAGRGEPGRQITTTQLAEQRPIEARFEAGQDPKGFALRLADLKEAPVAVFLRGKSLLVLVETSESLNNPTIPPDMAERIEQVGLTRMPGATMLRIQPIGEGTFQLVRKNDDLIIQRAVETPLAEPHVPQQLTIRRAFDLHGRESLEVPVGPVGSLFSIDDPATGQKLAVVPVPQAQHGMARSLQFAEFEIEPTLAGFVIMPQDEAVTLRRQPETVLIGHEIRLNLSALPQEAQPGARAMRPLMLDLDGWHEDARGPIRKIERDLLRAAAEAPRVTRSEARARLARFYLANRLYPEAQAVLDVLSADDKPAAASKQILFLKAFAATMMDRLTEATRLLNEPALAMEGEQKLLQGIVDTKAMRYAQANASFRQATQELDRYPEALQGLFRPLAVNAAIEAKDAVFAREMMQGFDKVDSRYRDPNLQQLLAGHLAQMQGRNPEAFQAYSVAAESRDRAIEAEARFGRAVVGLAEGKLTPEDARSEFETLSTIWRRSEVELKSLEKLGEIYAKDGRWREAFLTAQRASQIMPDHPITRRLEDAMGRRFENLFLDNEADKLPKVEALALYQEFRSLMPVGRRGDEIARRLADRLHELDLVDEAAEILEHQVRNRLEGIARASVATRLAVMHLQNRQPNKALTTLRTTRLANMPEDLRRPRAMLEARALGDLFRTDLAIEVLANDRGEDIDRLRADIYWKGKRWREAGESYERVLGEAWRGSEKLEAGQRMDALRAGLAYVLGGEKLALDRLRGRYLARMNETPDAGAFRLIATENLTQPQAFREVAKSVVNADTMTDFMAAYRKRYPDTAGTARPVRSSGDNRQSGLDPRDVGQRMPANNG
jgi:tetratricopeptide (TPR) repeat protein